MNTTTTMTRSGLTLGLLLLLLLPQPGQCFYNPTTGRWLSRDPVEERDCPHLYDFIGNDAANRVDFAGLMDSKTICPCDVQSFSIKSREWVGNLPATWEIFGYSKQLKIEFDLVLKPGSDKRSCRILQNRKGAALTKKTSWSSTNWVADGGEWWDGSKWSIRKGNWSGLEATFQDRPGLTLASNPDFPIYFNVDFYTFVLDASKSGSPEVAHVSWGVLIYYHTPSLGYEIYN